MMKIEGVIWTSSHRAMNILPLNPLQAEASEHAKGRRRLRIEGFVDEAVVRSKAMVVLSSSADDYTERALPVSSPFRDLVDDIDRKTTSVSSGIR